MSDTRAVILAGGFGTRIRHLLPDLPKPMAPVAGRPFVEWVMAHLYRSGGIRDFVLSTGYLAETVEAHFREPRIAGTTVRCCAERTPLGTAGGFLHCVSTDANPAPQLWLVANGDSLVLADLGPLLVAARAPGVAAAVLGVRMPDAARYGTLSTRPDGSLSGFCEKAQGAGLINAGVYVIRHDVLGDFPDRRPLSFETDVFPQLLARRRVAVVEAVAPFLDIGTETSFHEAGTFIARNQHQFTA